jgi:hypothetical protein
MTYAVSVKSGPWEVKADACPAGFLVEVWGAGDRPGSWTVTRDKQERVRQMLHGLAEDAVTGKRRSQRAIVAALDRLLGDPGTDSTIVG